MDLQRCGAVRGQASRFGSACRSPSGRYVLVSAFWLLCSAILAIGGVHAQSTRYVYDANGRVVAVTASNGTSVQYGYNTLGHASQVSAPLSPGQLAIFAFVPIHGEAGAQVTIQGQGFDSNVANDTVSFNGTVATVLSASATQLVTTVPTGATTGPIRVTVGSQTATSATSFVVDDTGLPPVITQVGPAFASIGSTVTVTGSSLDPVAGNTKAQMGGRDIPALSAASDAQLQYTVPSDAMSGYVTVATPYGVATSAGRVIVLPSGVSSSSVVSSGTATVDGVGVSLTIGAAGQVGALAFIAPQGGWVSLQASAMTTSASSVNYTVYAPGGGVVQQGTISASSPSIHLPHLAAGAIYLVLVQPSGGGAQLTMGVESNALLATSSAATVVTTVPGQSKRVLFNAVAGQNMAFLIPGTSTNPSNQVVSYTIYTPAGATYTSTTTAGTGVINLPSLPSTGTYQIVIAPGSGVTGSMQVEVAQAAGGVLSATPQHYATSVSGQNVYMSFTATQNENLELTLNNASVTGVSSNQFAVDVFDNAGRLVTSFSCITSNPGGSCTQHLWYLAAGAYTVVAVPNYGGVISFNARLVDDLIGPSMAAGSTANISLSAGQVERLTFNANAGDTVALNVSGITTSPAGQGVTFTVYAPNVGQAITTSTTYYTSFAPMNSQVINLSGLPVSGTYTVIVSPNYGVAANAQFAVVAGETGTMASNGASQSYTANVSGQNVYMSFTATQNENLELTLNNVSVMGASSNQFQVFVVNTAGNQIAEFSCYASNPGASCNQHLWYLAAGTYTVVAVPDYGGTLSFNALLEDDLIGPNVATGGTANISLGAGQVERLTFNANAGDTVALNVSGITTSPAGQGVTFAVYAPNVGQAITINTTPYTSFGPASSQVVNLSGLPVSGTYTVIVSPNYSLAANAQFTLVPGATGTMAPNGASQRYTSNVSSQNVYMWFTAKQNENLELTLNNVNVTGGSYNEFAVHVYNNAGAGIADFSCATNNPGASCTQHLWYLAAGTYTVVAVPNYGGTISFNALLQDDLIGPNVATGGTANISLSAGQVERLTFNANVGDTVALNVSGITTSPAGQGVTFTVYAPNVGQAITTNTAAYSSFGPTNSQVVNLSGLPASGTYTVIVSPNYGLAANAQFTLVPGETGTMAPNGASQSYTANVSGQNVYMSFTATQNENLELTLNHASATGGSANQFYVYVFDQAGRQVAGFSCMGSNPGASCNQHLWYLAAGTYTVVAAPNNGGTLSFNASLQDDLIGPGVATGGTANISLGAGQVERLTFSAKAGDTVALNVSGVTTSPSGQGVTFTVYAPNVGQAITTNTTAYSSFGPTGSQMVNLLGLPVSGTYTVIVSPNYGLAANAMFGVTSDTAGNPPNYGTPTITNDGGTQSGSSAGTGKNVTMTFNANQGDNLELTLGTLSMTGSYYFNVNVYDPSGSSVSQFNCYVSSVNCRAALWNLAAGTYQLVMSPPDSSSTVSLSAQITSEIVGPALMPNTPTAVSLDVAHIERYTFTANAGDTYALQISNVSGQPMTAYVYRPDTGAFNPGSPYASGTADSSGSQTINLQNLPASGTYTVVVYGGGGGPSSTAQLTLVAGATGSVSENGAAQSYTSPVAGQNVYTTFTASQGDNLELTLSNLSVAGSYYFQANVYAANGTNISSFNCYVSSVNCRASLWNLAAGTYTLVVSPPSMTSTVNFSAQITSDLIGSTLAPNTPVTVSLDVAHMERYTFNANAGDTYALQLSNVAGQSMSVLVYRPDTGAFIPQNAYTSFSATSLQTINLQNLPVSGTYTLVVYSGTGGPSSTGQLTLASGVTGAISKDGASQSYTSAIAGQNVYTTFTANPGDNLALTLSNLSVTGSSYFEVHIYTANGTNISYFDCSVSSVNCRTSLWNLGGGTYTLVVSPPPSTTSTVNFSAQLTSDVIGPTLTPGTPVTVNLDVAHVERYVFSANAGDTYALQLSNVTGQSMSVFVYRPDTGAFSSQSPYASFSTTSSQTINLQGLPASGNYTLVVYPGTGGPSSTAQLTLVPGVTGSVSENGTSQGYTTPVAGQNVYTTFTANPGDNLELTLSNLSVAGSYYFQADVYAQNGTHISSFSCFVSSVNCRTSLWNLSAGTYTLVATPPNATSAVNFTAQVTSDIIGPTLASNTPVTVNLGVAQVERYTFSAKVGDSYSLQLSNVTGQAMSVLVYRPDTGAISTQFPYASFSTSNSQAINLQNLPEAGTYTVVVVPGTGGPSSTAQMTLVPTTGSLGNFTAAYAGQTVQLTFPATAGANLELTLSNVTAASASTNGFMVVVTDPNGLRVANFYCYAASPGSSCTQPLWNLVAGTYSVAAVPVFGGSISFYAQIQPDAAGGALAPATASNVNMAAGQAERVTFSASQGANVVLQLASVNTTPANQPIYVDVYRPDVEEITPANAYARFNANSANSLNLSNLPVAGTYTAVLHTATGIPASAQISYAAQ